MVRLPLHPVPWMVLLPVSLQSPRVGWRERHQGVRWEEQRMVRWRWRCLRIRSQTAPRGGIGAVGDVRRGGNTQALPLHQSDSDDYLPISPLRHEVGVKCRE